MPHECTTCGRQFENGSKQMLSGCPDCGGKKFQFQPAGRNTGTSAGEASTNESSTAADTQTADAATADPATADPATADDAATADAGRSSPASAEADVEREMAELAKDRGYEIDGPRSDTTDSEPPTTEPDPAIADPESDTDEHDPGQATFDDVFRDAEIDGAVGDENSAQTDARSTSATVDEIDKARRKMAEAEQQRLSDVDANARGTPQGPPTESPSAAETEPFDISGAVGPDDGDPMEKQPVAGSAPESEPPVADEDTDLAALREELNDQFESIKITAPGQYELNLMELFDRDEYIISLQEDGRYVIELADNYGGDK